MGIHLPRVVMQAKRLQSQTISSAIGGLIGALILSFLAPQIAKIAVRFGPPEYVLLGVYGLTMISYVAGTSLIKGLFAGCIGLLISTFGIDPITSVPRFTFGTLNLLTGFELLPILIGIFAMSQAIEGVRDSREIAPPQVKLTKVGISMKEFFRILPHIVKSAFIGTFVGAVPGTGTDIAAFLSYGEAKRSSKHPEEFGKGSIEGVAAPESGNNACVNGAMIPMFTLGIPGEAATAVILGGLMVLGLQPGPLLFSDSPDVIYTVFASTITSNVFMIILGIVGARFFAKVLSLPKSVIVAFIFVFSVLGAYSMRNSMFDIVVMMTAGLLGYIFSILDYPVPPVLLGVILGPLVESNLGRTFACFGWKPAHFLQTSDINFLHSDHRGNHRIEHLQTLQIQANRLSLCKECQSYERPIVQCGGESRNRHWRSRSVGSPILQ